MDTSSFAGVSLFYLCLTLCVSCGFRVEEYQGGAFGLSLFSLVHYI